MASLRRDRSVQKMKSRDHAREHAQKLLQVLVIEKDVLPGIPPGGHVIERSGEFDTEWASHGRESSSSVMHHTKSDPFSVRDVLFTRELVSVGEVLCDQVLILSHQSGLRDT
jgi:hypothetical protein